MSERVVPFRRDVNEWLRALQPELGTERGEFLCECRDGRCSRRLRLTLLEFESIRARPGRYLVAPGHEHDARVVALEAGFSIVDLCY